MIDRELFWDMELPLLAFIWREYAPNDPDGVMIDFTAEPHTFKMKFIVPRTGTVAYQKTSLITAYDHEPNVVAMFSPNELQTASLRGEYMVRLLAHRVSDGADRPFPRDLTFDVQPTQ